MSRRQICDQGVWVAERGTGAGHTLMLHCSLARHETLLRLAGMCAGRVTLFDLPGHGRSDDAPDGVHLHDHTTEITRALIEEGSHVIGHSFGATVALRLALADPRITRLTLIEPVLFSAAAGAPGYIQHAADYAPVEEAFARGDAEFAAQAFLAIWGMGVPWDMLPERVRDEARRSIHQIAAFGDILHHDVIGITAPGRLESLTIPVTLIRGAQSHPVMADIHAALEARLGNVEAHVIAGAGHMVPITHPGKVGAAMGLG